MRPLKIIRIAVAAVVVLVWLAGAIFTLPVIDKAAIYNPTVIGVLFLALGALGWDKAKKVIKTRRK